MSKNYCVFWYPTIFHQEKVHRASNESTSFMEVSDNDTAKGFFLKVTEIPVDSHPRCFNLVFTLSNDSKSGPTAKSVNCEFTYSSHTRNGFVTYTYDREELKRNYWDAFLNSEDERRMAIEALRVRLHNRIKKKYGHLLSSDREAQPSDELIKDYVIDRILISFYHHAKGFYHEHEVQSQSDGKLKAYYYSKEYQDGHREYLTAPPTLSIKNNEVINWYLDQYEKQFIGYAEEISKQHREFTKRINLRRRSRNALAKQDNVEIQKCLIEYECLQKSTIKSEEDTLPSIAFLVDEAKQTVLKLSLKEQRQELQERTDSTSKSELNEIKELHAKLRVLSKLCGDALTEYTYCKALLGSKYNDDYKHDRFFNRQQVGVLSLYPNLSPNLSTLDDRRKKAFNIRNSIRYIEGVKQNCSRWENELTENLIEQVHVISKDHQTTLEKIGDLIGEVKSLSEKHKEALETIQNLSKEATTLSAENKNMLKESEKSNKYSSLLGYFSVALGIIGVGFALMNSNDNAGQCLIGIGVAIALCGFIKYLLTIIDC